jgi:hypothetical protein
VGRRAKNSQVDLKIKEWAKTRRQLVGVDDPKKSKDFIGALRCTLAHRRDLHAGSKSNTLDIQWPEVYEGESAIINRAFHRMRPWLKVVMDTHFVANADPRVKADFLAISLQSYWREVNDVRTFVEGYLASHDS